MRKLIRGRSAIVVAALATTMMFGVGTAGAAPVPARALDTWAVSDDIGRCGIVRIPMTVGLASGWPGGEAYILLSPEFYLPDLTHQLTQCMIAVTVHWENLDTGATGSRTVYPMDSRENPAAYQTSGNAASVASGLGRVRFWLSTATPHVSAPPIETVISL
ncbi:hypothetical protein O4215_11955 [Rhodococcus maanshanensis]|uniref:hypothetical protein n=1 Tax=Rhodococcus maanshanensis TaxID=183556 RepID=UPI0022B574B5|nr:hypothetical protein [Rhodococcus maanshanensis]MCZ4556288.1 hypothetical protein [Rhodococcus maanshanensis]